MSIKQLALASALLGATGFVLATAQAQEPSPSPAAAQEQYEFFAVLPESERAWAREIYVIMPEGDQVILRGFMKELKPEVATYVVRGLYTLNRTPLAASDPGATMADDELFVVFVDNLPEADREPMRTAWADFTPEQRRNLVALVRHARFGGFAAARQSTVTTTEATSTPPPTQTETQTQTETVTETTTVRAQPFFDPMAGLSEPARGAYTSFVNDLRPVEQTAYARFLSQMTPEQAAVVARAIDKLNQQGKSGSAPREGVSKEDAFRMMADALDGADRSTFEGMWNSLSFEQRTIILILARDAINGGLNDPA